MLLEISLQGVIIIPLFLVMIFFKIKRTHTEHFYNTLSIGLILFVIINFILGLSSENLLIYLLASLGLFLIIFFVGIFVAKLISGKSLSDIQSAAMVFLVPLIVYVFSIIITLIVKFIF